MQKIVCGFEICRKKKILCYISSNKFNAVEGMVLIIAQTRYSRAKHVIKEVHPSGFSPVTSTDVGFNPKTVWLLVLTLLPH